MQNKQDQIVSMFDEIAKSYDATNRIMSLGVDKIWRKDSIKQALQFIPQKDLKIVDIACGTGDMLMQWKAGLQAHRGDVEFIGIDPSAEMLKIAEKKLQKEGIKALLMQGLAQDLRLEASSADILSIAFGVRNVVEIDRALAEFSRVLKPGGILVFLEFMRYKKTGILQKVMNFYTCKILPLVGGAFSKNYGAYRYLPDSINGFLSIEEFCEKLKQNQLQPRVIKGYSANVCSLIIVQKQ